MTRKEKKWLPDEHANFAKASEAAEELADLLQLGMRKAFEVGFNVANEINRPVIYKNE